VAGEKLRTKQGNLVVLPTRSISKEAIVNYSEPAVPTRLESEVGVSYDVPPNQVKAALLEAVGNAPMALPEPAADALVVDFGSSAWSTASVSGWTTSPRRRGRATRCGRRSTTR